MADDIPTDKKNNSLRYTANVDTCVHAKTILPIESLWADSLEVMPLLGPVAPGGVLEPQSVDKIVLLLRHKLP